MSHLHFYPFRQESSLRYISVYTILLHHNLSFLQNHNRVKRFDFVDDNNAIVCPYKGKSTDVTVCLSLYDDKRERMRGSCHSMKRCGRVFSLPPN